MAAESLDSVLGAAAETGAVVIIRGISDWLGREHAPDDDDFMASLVGGFTESFEDFCDRISRKEAAS